MKIFELDYPCTDFPSMPCGLVLGNFDGVHKGHQTIISRMVKSAEAGGFKSAVFTFANHPKNVLAGETVVKNILYPEEKAQIIESLGVDYLFNPDFSKIDGKAVAAALGQAFFSLSLGFGTILTYASYVSKKENVMFQSVATAISDLMFALIAGLAIMPAVFAFGLSPDNGPGLVFETLPHVFGQMPGGGLIAILFFLALIVAALTSSISMLEVGVAYLIEEKKFKKGNEKERGLKNEESNCDRIL